jgi:hypothetical protein
MAIREIPVICQLCGEHLPNPDAAWDHDCPEWRAQVRKNLPTLAAHRNIIRFYERTPDGIWKWMVRYGIRLALGVDADLLDALIKMKPRYSYRTSKKLVKRGLVKDVLEKKQQINTERKMYGKEFPEEEPF